MLYLNTSSDTLSWLISGSFGISGTELATFASLLLPITIILFDNGSFGWMKMLQRLYYDKWDLGVDFTNTTDTASIAEAFGLRGVCIPDPDHLSPVRTEALASNEPVFIDIPKKPITPVQALHAKGLLGVGGSIPRISRHVTSTCSFDKNRSTIKQGRISTTSFEERMRCCDTSYTSSSNTHWCAITPTTHDLPVVRGCCP